MKDCVFLRSVKDFSQVIQLENDDSLSLMKLDKVILEGCFGST